MAGIWDFTIEQGSTFSRTITWKDQSGSPVDITGFTAQMKIKGILSDVITLTHENGLTLGGSAGTIKVEIAATMSSSFDFTKAKYDLELYNGAYTKRLLKGSVLLDKETTK